jgi:hypothetical protein
MMKFLDFAQSVFLAPAYADDKSSLHAWRERVLSANFFVVASVGMMGFIAFVVADLVRGANESSYLTEAPIVAIGYLALIAMAFGRRLPFKLRAGSLVFSVCLIAFSDKLQAGLSGIGELLLLTLVVLMVIFGGMKGGMVAIGLNIAIMAIPGWLMLTGRKPLPGLERVDTSGKPFDWVLVTLALVVLGMMLVVSTATMMQGIKDCLDQRRDGTG